MHVKESDSPMRILGNVQLKQWESKSSNPENQDQILVKKEAEKAVSKCILNVRS